MHARLHDTCLLPAVLLAPPLQLLKGVAGPAAGAARVWLPETLLLLPAVVPGLALPLHRLLLLLLVRQLLLLLPPAVPQQALARHPPPPAAGPVSGWQNGAWRQNEQRSGCGYLC